MTHDSDARVVPLTILVFDPYPGSALALAQLFRLHGHLATALDKLAALEVAAIPDVVVMEPRIRDGWAVVQRLRARAGPQTVFVAVTSGAGPEDIKNSAAAGFEQHFVKPVDPVALELMLLELVARRRRASGLE